MTKRIARVAVVLGAAAVLAAPAAPASASCNGTFIADCVRDALAAVQPQPQCIPFYTFDLICI